MDRCEEALHCQIRRFVEADRMALRLVYLNTRRQAFHWMNPDELVLAEFDAATADELVLVAETDGEVVGFVSLWLPENFIHNLFVSPGHQGRGIGTRLLAASRDHLAGPARLKCSIHNTRARAFYESRGWVVLGRGGDRKSGYLDMEWPQDPCS